MRPALKSSAAIVLTLASLGAVGLAIWSNWARPQSTGPRNILVLILDGVGTRVGAYGAPVQTPNLDRLSRQGRRFELAFRNHPATAISRSSFWLGRRPESWQAWDHLTSSAFPQGAAPLAQLLAARGYFTGRVGSPMPGGEGDGRWQATDDAGGAPQVDQAGVDARTRRAVEWMERPGSRPFLIAAIYAWPPPGWLPPQAFLKGHPATSRVPSPPARDWSQLPKVAAPGGPAAPMVPPPDTLPDGLRRRRQAAADASISFLDAQVGFLLDAVERLGLERTTTVVALGDPLSSPSEPWRSNLLFDDSLRASLIIRSPEVRRTGRAAGSPVELLDLHLTLLELAGVPPSAGVEGRSLVPLLRNAGAAPDRAAVSVLPRDVDRLGRSIQTEHHRYTRWPDGSEELYDHDRDPLEQVNRIRLDPPLPVLAELRRALHAGPSVQTGVRAAPFGRGAPDDSRPLNVVLVVADDLNVRLGCYGYEVRTPNLDRLASQGRRFEHAYAQCPSCSPSRTSFLTGLRPDTTGVWNNTQSPRETLVGAVPLQDHFRRHGYFTARVGKVYHGPFEEQFRWDLAEHSDYSGVQEEDPPLRHEGRGRRGGLGSFWQATDLADEDEPDGRTARRVAGLIRERRDRPFFIAVGFNKPHLRWTVPRRYFDLYPPEHVRIPAEAPDDWRDIPEIAIARGAPRFAGALLRGPLEPPDLRRQAIAAYQASVSFMDAQLGVVLEALDRAQLRDRTVVVVLGDHGFHLGEHTGLWRKNTLFEESLRTPLVIAAPNTAQPGVPNASPVELVDLYPTLLDLARLPAVPGLEGTTLLPAIRDPGARIKLAAFSATERTPPAVGVSLRTHRYRYTLWPDGSEELYDHARDPTESHSLGASPAHAATRDRLRTLLDHER